MKPFAPVWSIGWLWLAAGFLSPLAWSQAVSVQPDGVQWLQRVTSAAQKLSYSGTFVYRNGSRSETSRIVHLASNGNQMEKLEVLDGSPREVIRLNDEVRCYLPESHLVIVEQRSVRRSFPALLPASLAGLSDHYIIRKGSTARVAGFDSQIVRLEPRDAWRYGHQLWVDVGSGLLLKADIFDERGESLESMVFTALHIGEPATPDALKSSYAAAAREGWQLRQAKLRDLRDDAQWLFRAELPGFRRQASMRRSMGKDAEDLNMLHWVFSDGLAALSVFISPLRQPAESGEESVQSLGALSVMKRVVDGHQIVVMGDLPPAAVKRFAEGIGVRGK
jgi:sigma-E factor negative regulatory protein RseB